jgi:PAS domain S-box-containing protein
MSSQPSYVEGGKVGGAELFAAALQTVAQPVWVVDHGGLIRFANPAALAALGYSDAEELIGRDSHETIHHHHPDGRPYPVAECPMMRPRLTGQTVTSDLDWFFRRDGSMFRVSYISAPLEMADGRGAVVAFTDIEQRLRADEALRERERRLAKEQEALRRVAMRVARGSAPEPVFRDVADELEALLGCDISAIVRFEADGTVAVKGAHGSPYTVGAPIEVDPDYVVASVRKTGRAARFDADDPATGAMPEVVRALGIRSGLASPIVVDGVLWGAIAVASLERSLPEGAEGRLADVAELLATAISNARARHDLRRLAEEQAALRRVATLVAEGASPRAVLDAVAAEMAAVLDADQVVLSRYEPGEAITVVAHRGPSALRVPPGTRVSHDGENVQSMVRHTARAARIEKFQEARGTIADLARSAGARVVVGAPIVVEGGLWGVISASWNREDAPPADTEERMAHFAELLDTAIANAESRAQLNASRARLLTEADDARRRVVRDLHDGAQQRLVHTILTLKLAQRAFREDSGEAESLVADALNHAEQGNAELRELAHGILPPVLARGGLKAGVRSVVNRLDLPVEVDVPAERFPEEIEASAYFIVAEALTNVVKHSRAGHAEVKASVADAMLNVEVRDDGIGGADPHGHGLVGIGDRVNALGGRLTIETPATGGTLLSATLPLAGG